MELDWGQHSNSDKVPRWIPYDMQGTLRVWITRAWPPYARLTFQKVYQDTFSGFREPRWNPVSPTAQWLSPSCAIRKTCHQDSAILPNTIQEEKTHPWYTLYHSQEDLISLTTPWVIMKQYSFVPTTMCLELVDVIRFEPWGVEHIQWPSPLAACLAYRTHR